jgi:hypothetical protein
MTPASAWQAAAIALIGGDACTARWVNLGGTPLNATWRLDAGFDRFFVKTNTAARLPMLEAEADGAAARRAIACQRPWPRAASRSRAQGWSLQRRPRCRARAGLAQSDHGAGAWRHRDNVGTTPQDNAGPTTGDVLPRSGAPHRWRRAGWRSTQRDGEGCWRRSGTAPRAAPSLRISGRHAARLASGEPVIFVRGPFRRPRS